MNEYITRRRREREALEEIFANKIRKYGLTVAATTDGVLVTEAGTAHLVHVENGCPSSCSCPAFQRSKTACRHTQAVALKMRLDECDARENVPQELNCHEVWEYDDSLRVAILVGLRALCASCHAVVHGNISEDKPSLQKASRLAERRGRHAWTISYGPYETEPWARKLPRQVPRWAEVTEHCEYGRNSSGLVESLTCRYCDFSVRSPLIGVDERWHTLTSAETDLLPQADKEQFLRYGRRWYSWLTCAKQNMRKHIHEEHQRQVG